MAVIDKNVVLNSNPKKVLRVAFENLKSNYNDSSAKSYMELYKDKPLAFLLENSRYIFSEPLYGLRFYIESVLSNDHALLFTEYEEEKEKIEDYIEDYGDKMPEAQKKLYNDLLALVTKKYEESVHTARIISHACANKDIDKIYKALVESVYELPNNPDKVNDIVEFMNVNESADLFYALSPYLCKYEPLSSGYIVSSNLGRFFKECTIENQRIKPEEWDSYIRSIVITSKLYGDEIYRESVKAMRTMNAMIFEGLATESVKDQIKELSILHVTENAGLNKFNTTTFDSFYSTPNSAVNRIFEDDDLYDMMKEENESFKTERTNLQAIAYSILMEYVTHEYQSADNVESDIIGYNYFEKGTSIEEAYADLSVSPFLANTLDEEITLEAVGSEPKKANAPAYSGSNASWKNKNTNIATHIQNSAMDAEAQYYKSKANKRMKGQAIKNAAKAVTAIPNDIANSIKQTVADWDHLDDERRKNYIVKPGFRKKIFRNLKLAILYGGAASIKFALVPVVFAARHLSKQKDKRIRNELAREIDTNIKVTEEKINDATAAGDTQEKYRLMRIKSDLEKEALRVKANSRYV